MIIKTADGQQVEISQEVFMILVEHFPAAKIHPTVPNVPQAGWSTDLTRSQFLGYVQQAENYEPAEPPQPPPPTPPPEEPPAEPPVPETPSGIVLAWPGWIEDGWYCDGSIVSVVQDLYDTAVGMVPLGITRAVDAEVVAYGNGAVKGVWRFKMEPNTSYRHMLLGDFGWWADYVVFRAKARYRPTVIAVYLPAPERTISFL